MAPSRPLDDGVSGADDGAVAVQRAHKVDAREALQVDLAQLQVLEEPIVLLVAVRVLTVAQRVRPAYSH